VEIRKGKVHIGKPGGNAGKTSKNHRVSLPTTWMQTMKITLEERDITLSFDGERIILEKDNTTNQTNIENPINEESECPTSDPPV